MSIFIGTPVHHVKRYCLDAWLESLDALAAGDVRTLLVNNSDDPRFAAYLSRCRHPVVAVGGSNLFNRIGLSRKTIIDRFLDSGCDRLFSLECDVFCDPQAMRQLASHREDAVGAPYPLSYLNDPRTRLKRDYIVSAMDERRINYTLAELLALPRAGPLARVNENGLGCMMFSRSVVDRFFRDIPLSDEDCDDKFIYRALRAAEVPVYVDVSLAGSVRHYPHFHMEYAVLEEKHKVQG